MAEHLSAGTMSEVMAARATGTVIVQGNCIRVSANWFCASPVSRRTINTDMFGWLKSHGLQGVEFIVPDSHAGLNAAATKHFQGAIWQRCQIHLMRNVWAKANRKYRETLNLIESEFTAHLGLDLWPGVVLRPQPQNSQQCITGDNKSDMISPCISFAFCFFCQDLPCC